MDTAPPDSRQQILFMALALAATLPGVYLRITGIHPEPILPRSYTGWPSSGQHSSSSWAAEVIQMDIAAGLALALLALIAILPEYAVDFVFTAKAGQEFAETGQSSQYGPLPGQYDRGQPAPHRAGLADGDPDRHLAGQEDESASRGCGGDHGDRDQPLPVPVGGYRLSHHRLCLRADPLPQGLSLLFDASCW